MTIIVTNGDAGQLDMAFPGGKNGAGTLHRLIGLMPLHRHYFELCLGGGAVIRRKTPAPGMNIGVEIDPKIIAMHGGEGHKTWGVLRRGNVIRALSTYSAMTDPETLVYIDPPYLRSTRTRLIYTSEMASPAEHAQLLNAAIKCKCMVMISGYHSELYAKKLRRWRMVSWPAMTRGGLRRECVWMNFAEPAVFHDPIFAAVGFRERERVKRRAQRWSSRFAAMTPAERQVVWSSLSAAMSDRGA